MVTMHGTHSTKIRESKAKSIRSNFEQTLLNLLKQNRLILFFFIVYLVVTFVVAIFFHENWEDEAQAWLTARDCTPLELIGRMRYEGHLLPWYLIIMPFAKLGFSFKTVNFISWVISGLSAWLILKYLPCKKYKRILFIFTVPMFYFFPVVARCYCLIPLATILLIIFYKNRLQRPMPYLLSVVLMANIHIYCFVFAFILGLDFIIDWIRARKNLSKKQHHKLLVCTIIAICIAGISYIPLIGSVDGGSGISLNISNFDLKNFLIGNTNNMLEEVSLFMPIAVLGVIVCIIASWFIINRPSAAMKIFLCLIWQFFIINCIFDIILPQRVFINLFIVLYFLMCPRLQKVKTLCLPVKIIIIITLIILTISSGAFVCETMLFSFLIFAFLPNVGKINQHFHAEATLNSIFRFTLLVAEVLLVIDSIIIISKDIRFTYTASYATANWIESTISNENSYIFLTDQPPNNIYTSLIAYMDNRDFMFFDVQSETYYTYSHVTSNSNGSYDNNPLADKPLANFCGTAKKCFYIEPYNNEFENKYSFLSKNKMLNEYRSDDGLITKIYDSNETDDGWSFAPFESFRIYRVNNTR